MPHGKELPARVHAVLLLAFSYPTASVSVFRDTCGGASPLAPKYERNAGAGSRARLLLLVPKQFILVIIWTFDAPAHLVDHGTGQVAGRGQLQSTCLGCSSQQEYRIGRDRGCRDFCRSQVVFEADGRITGRGFVMKGIETVEFEHGPGRFDAIEPPTNLGILEES